VALVGLAFVSNMSIPKPRGVFYVILPTMAIAMSLFWLAGPVPA